MTKNTNPAKFGIDFKWDTPWVWKNSPGQNLLIEIRNTSTGGLGYFVDAISGDANVARVYSTSGANALTGSVTRKYGLVMRFDSNSGGKKVPLLSMSAKPIIGRTCDVRLSSARPSTAAALIIGTSRKQWGPITLPWDLSALGAQGCQLLVSLDSIVPTPVDTSGNAKVSFALPNNPSLRGVTWHNQFLVFDAGMNKLGLVFSNGNTLEVGDQ